MFQFQKMQEESLRLLSKKLRSKGKTYGEIGSILDVSLFTAMKLCKYDKRVSKKRGPKFKVHKATQLAIMSHVKKLNQGDEKILSSRQVSDLKLNLSINTVHRHMQRCGYIYKNQNCRSF